VPFSLELAGNHKQAADAWARLGCRYEAALALAWAEDDALLLRALDDLQRLGAAAAARLVARRLRKRGVRKLPRGPRPATRENSAGLTARELEVVRLLAEGHTNQTIADRLYVSPRTIDRHVSSLLRKLDAGTRGQAVAGARRLGLVEDR
jgi:DNA-binding CsgD family transcriptional regulator